MQHSQHDVSLDRYAAYVTSFTGTHIQSGSESHALCAVFLQLLASQFLVLLILDPIYLA